MYLVHPGELVGTLPVLTGEPSFFTVRIMTDSRLVLISKNDFYSWGVVTRFTQTIVCFTSSNYFVQSIIQFKTTVFSCLHGSDGPIYNTPSTHPGQPAAPTHTAHFPPPLFTHWTMIGRSTAHMGRNRPTARERRRSCFVARVFYGRMPFLPPNTKWGRTAGSSLM